MIDQCQFECATEERWRPVIAFEGLYEVSNLGRVRSVARFIRVRDGKRLMEGRILKIRIDNEGYPRVTLCNAPKEVTSHVHRLVAEAFVAGCGPLVRHLDGNPQNCRDSNLAWGSYPENEADKARHGKTPRGESHVNSKMTDTAVRQIRELHARGFTQLSIAEALGLNRGVVGNVVRKEGWTHVI